MTAVATKAELMATLLFLRRDAKTLGMLDLAYAYGEAADMLALEATLAELAERFKNTKGF
jgi:hypothetical protein